MLRLRPTLMAAVWLLAVAHGASAQEKFHIGSLTFEGNKVTKERILLREMTFREGDSIPVARMAFEMERSRSNLRNAKLFNFIEVDTCLSDGGWLDVVVRVVERWYVWPVPIAEIADRNFSEWWETKDFSRIDFGTYVFWHNFRGLREELVLELRFGYNNRFQLRYEIPYLDRKQRFGIEFKGGYEQAREVSVGAAGNKRQFIRSDGDFVRRMAAFAVTPRWRPGLYNQHEVELSFNYGWAADTVIRANKQFFGKGLDETRHFAVQYQVTRDLTDYTIYPLRGYLFHFKLRKDGLGILDSPVDMLYMEVEFNKYWPLHKRWYFAHGQKIRLSSTNDQPYFYQRGLGYRRDFVRGYELYVVDGQQFGIVKASLRWMLLQPKRIHLKFLKSDKLGLIPITIFANANLDVGYVHDSQFARGNPLAGQLLLGGGPGIDLSTFYDIVWRFEYSFNRHGQHGFFLHFFKHI